MSPGKVSFKYSNKVVIYNIKRDITYIDILDQLTAQVRILNLLGQLNVQVKYVMFD